MVPSDLNECLGEKISKIKGNNEYDVPTIKLAFGTLAIH